MELSRLLTIYIGALSVMCFTILWLVFHLQDKKGGFPYEPLIGILNGILLVASLIVTRTTDQTDISENPIIQIFPFILVVISVICLLLAAKRSRGCQRWLVFFTTIFFIITSVVLFSHEKNNNLADMTISVLLSDVKGETGSFERNVAIWEQDTADEFEKKTGIKVKLIPPEKEGIKDRLEDVQKRLKQDKELNEKKDKKLDEKGNYENAEKHVDVLAIDVIWPTILAEDAVDLRGLETFKNGKSPDSIFPTNIIKNNTVGKKLVAVPWFIDMGLLFYRSDLLEKYEYGDEPPKTWEKLTEMAKKIQAGERRKNPDFWGFIWQGVEEGLTCNALEWQSSYDASYDGGKLLAENTTDIDYRKTEAAFKQARSWIQNDKISPSDLNLRTGKKTRSDWIAGNAAFVRHWPSTYNASLQAKNSKIKGDGKVGVALLPKPSQGGIHASTLGGWQLMVNKYSDEKHQKAASKFVEFLISEDMQKQQAIRTGRFPALKGLMTNPKVQDALEFINDNESLKPIIHDEWESVTVARPSTIAGEKYQNLSNIYSKAVTSILLDKSSRSISEQLKELAENMRTALRSQS